MEIRPGHYLYKTFYSISTRCYCPSHSSYHFYGGRGIEMHAPWREDRDLFFNYILEELGERPDGCQLDRIDNDGNYEPGNLRWATPSENMSNRRPYDQWEFTEPTRHHTKKNYKIGKSGFRWVVAKKKKWYGSFWYQSRQYWTRVFPTPEEAYNEVLQMRAEMGLPLE